MRWCLEIASCESAFVSSFWQKFAKWVRYSTEQNFECIQEERRPRWRPDPEDLKYVGEAMEVTYEVSGNFGTFLENIG